MQLLDKVKLLSFWWLRLSMLTFFLAIICGDKALLLVWALVDFAICYCLYCCKLLMVSLVHLVQEELFFGVNIYLILPC